MKHLRIEVYRGGVVAFEVLPEGATTRRDLVTEYLPAEAEAVTRQLEPGSPKVSDHWGDAYLVRQLGPGSNPDRRAWHLCRDRQQVGQLLRMWGVIV